MLSKKNIFFLFSLLFLLCLTPRVFALNGNFDSVLMCSNSLGCNTSTTLPYSYAYSDSARINFSSINLVRGKTYNISFYANITSPGFTFSTGYPQLFVIDSNNNATRAYPDRGESLLVNNTGGNTYSVNWTFELDNTGGNYVGAYVIFTFSANYNANIYSTYINSSNFLYFDSADPSGNQDIINNQNNNTQNVINNNNNNTQTIINNQNENTNKEIESQKVCNTYGKNDYSINNKFLNVDGVLYDSSSFGVSDYINIINADIEITPRSGTTSYSCFYNKNKIKISCFVNSSSTVSIPDDSVYVRFSVYKNESIPRFKVCKNGNQALTNQMEDINNSLNDDSEPDTNNFLQDISSMVSSDTPITDLLTLPLTLINTYVDSLNGTCTPFDLGELYNTHIIFPCINLESKLGSNLWGLIDSFFTLFMVYNVALLCVHIYDSMTSLNDSFDALYTPKHVPSSYQPRHGE